PRPLSRTHSPPPSLSPFFFFFNHTPPPDSSPLSLHDALPISRVLYINSPSNPTGGVLTREDLTRLAEIARERALWVISDEASRRSEEHTSELQSLTNLVCRLLLEKKKQQQQRPT